MPHSALGYISPYEKLYGKKPDLSYLRIFGSQVDVLDELVPRGHKFDSRSKPTVYYLVGFGKTGYYVYEQKTKQSHYVTNARVYESRFYRDDYPTEDELETFHFPDLPTDDLENVSMECDEMSGSPREDSEKIDVATLSTTTPMGTSQENCEEFEIDVDFNWDTSQKEQSNTFEVDIDFDWDDPNEQTLVNSCVSLPSFLMQEKELPLTYDEAVSGPDANLWKEAIAKELGAIHSLEVWNIVPKTKRGSSSASEMGVCI